MTNLAYRQPREKDNVTYVDFAAHAARKKALQNKKSLGLQHRYGLCLLALCAVALCVSLVTAPTDLTAVLVLAPLGGYLLTTKKVILYRPGRYR